MKKFAFPLVITLVIAVLAYVTNVPQTLGAHPFWAERTILLGAPLGLILGYAATHLPYNRAIIGLGGLTLVTFAIAHTGKTRFAASYAEDAFAGQMWFFGWHAVVVVALATLFVAATGIKQN